MKHEIEVLAFTKYDDQGASSRLRTIQYKNKLKKNGINITISPLFDNQYLEELYTTRASKTHIIKCYIQRMKLMFQLKKFDLIWIEKELFPWIPLPFEKIITLYNKKYIVDYDDAIFHTYDKHRLKIIQIVLKNKISKVMCGAAVVTVCNQYLKDKALSVKAKDIEVIPTVVDIEKYQPVYNARNDVLTIGWIGTPKTEQYLIDMQEIFNNISKKFKIKLVIIGGKNFDTKKFNFEILDWSEKKEVELLQNIDIGIMPLRDSAWEKGKCGYKLIQYMACGKPVVGSEVGMNCEIIHNGENGYLANTEEEWINAIVHLHKKEQRIKMGKYARQLVETKYSLQSTMDKRINIIKKVLNET